MRALITGASGFVGHYLSKHLLGEGDEVFACDRIASNNVAQQLPAGCKFEMLDVCDARECASLVSRVKPQVIYHLAGISFVPEAEDDFNKTLLANVGGTSNIFRVCHLMDEKCRVVLISSAEVYGKIKQQDLPLSEKQQLSPANNYSLSKVMAELVAQRYTMLGSVQATIMRPFNHIGPGQNERFVCSNFAMQLARVARGKAPSTIYVGNLEARRDFSDVRDVVRAYRLAAIKGEGIYNIGSGVSVRIREILDKLVAISGAAVEIKEDPARMRAAEVPEIYGSYQRAKVDLGWQPQHKLDDTLRELFAWWYERV